jgi:hypothetical protein
MMPSPVKASARTPAAPAWRVLIGALVPFIAAVGCSTVAAPSRPLGSAPEPAASPPLSAAPAGTVLAVAGEPEGVAVDADGVVAVNLRKPDGLALFDIAHPTRTRFVALPGSARHLELAGPEGPLLVPEESADRLVEVALPSGGVVASVPVGRQPHDAAAAAGGRVFVGDELANTVHVIDADGTTNVVAAPLQPGGVAASPDGSLVVVVGVRGRRITAYRSDGVAIGTANCGAGPTHVVAGDGGLFWVVDTNGGAVLAFRVGASGPVQVARIPIGGRPYGVAYDGRRHTLWVTLTAPNQLLGLQLHGAGVVHRVVYATVRQPNTVAVDVATGELVVTGSGSPGALELIG